METEPWSSLVGGGRVGGGGGGDAAGEDKAMVQLIGWERGRGRRWRPSHGAVEWVGKGWWRGDAAREDKVMVQLSGWGRG